MSDIELVKLYDRVVASVNYRPDEDGAYGFKFKAGEETVLVPANIDSKSLVMPEARFMKGEMLKSRVVFHPLSEDVMCAESEVLQFLRRSMGIRFNATFASLFLWMVETANDPKASKKFGPKQKEFFSILADVSKSTVAVAVKLVKAWLKRDAEWTLSKIYLRRTGAVYEGKKMTRAAVVTFPFLDEEQISNKDKKTTWCGVDISKKDLHMLRGLAMYLIPGGDNQAGEGYNAGSIDPHAPYFDCLIRSFEKMMEPLNNVILLLGERYDGAENGFCDTTWVAEFNPISKWRSRIPVAEYNRGVPLSKKPAPTTPTVENKPAAPTTVNGILAEQATPITSSKPANSLDAILERAMQQAQPQAPVNRWDNAPTSTDPSSGGLSGIFARLDGVSGGSVGGGGWSSMVPQAPTAPVAPTLPINGVRARGQLQAQTAMSQWTGRNGGGWG